MKAKGVGMKLENVVPWGRSLEEYIEFFMLSEDDLSKRILGCSDGPASFNSELSKRGADVTSIDPIYKFSAQQLKNRIAEAYAEIMPQMLLNQDNYLWKSIPSVERLGQLRSGSMNTFIADFDEGKNQGRYLEGALPNIDIVDNAYDLALCSHYLFLYSKQLNLGLHLASLKELARVAKEVRVYPLITLKGEVSPHLSPVMALLNVAGYSTSLVDVSYEFQKGANQMLVVKSLSDI